jgi:uncharacterized protein YndB with AHSA1/START domain
VSEGLLRLDGSARAVRFERVLAGGPEEVWSALTEPARLRRWLAEAELDLREGGAVSFRFGDTPDQHVTGRVLAVDEPRLLEYEWTWPGQTESVVRWELSADGAGGTRVVLDHRRLPADAATGYGAGWHAYLDLLEAHLGGEESADWGELVAARLDAYQGQARAL